MYDYTAPSHRRVTLDEIKVGLQMDLPLPASASGPGSLVDLIPDHVRGRLVARVTTQLCAERLPPQSFVIYRLDPRWASPWDMWKAMHRNRWYAAWWVRRRPPRTVDTTVRAVVNVAAMWQYPDTPIRPLGMGAPVVYTMTTDGGDGI